jgi:hypothetical protein
MTVRRRLDATLLGVWLSGAGVALACPATNVNEAGPWFSSAAPFEHADSSRSHLFAAIARPSASELRERPVSVEVRVAQDLPGIWNIATRGAGELLVLAGALGANTGSAGGPFVAMLDPGSMKEKWRTRLLPPDVVGEWNYPGSIGVHANGYIYAVFGYRLAKLEPGTGRIVAVTVLPTAQRPADVAYNGFVATSDGTLVMKSLHRVSGCAVDGFRAVMGDCGSGATPPSTIVAVDPDSMKVVSALEAPETIGGRITATRWDGRDLIYAPGQDFVHRFVFEQGSLRRDASWGPVAYRLEGQATATAAAALRDVIILQTNALPSRTPMSLIAISQADAKRMWRVQPFRDRTGSFMPSMPSVDPEDDTIFSIDGGANRVVALGFTPASGFVEMWRAEQSSFSFSALIGPRGDRVFISSATSANGPFNYDREQVVWRQASTGAELARGPWVERGAGLVITPDCGGVVYYPTVGSGKLYRFRLRDPSEAGDPGSSASGAGHPAQAGGQTPGR